MTRSIDEFTTVLTIEACIADLKALPEKYSSRMLTISIAQLKGGSYHFELSAKGITKAPIDMRIRGLLKQAASSSTQVSIEDIVPGKLGYITQYLWILSPIFLIIALMSRNPYVLLAVPAVVIFSLLTLVTKAQDKDEMLRIIHRALDPK